MTAPMDEAFRVALDTVVAHISPDVLFSAVLLVSYRAYSRREWTFLPAVPGKSDNTVRSHYQELLLVCAEAARKTSGKTEATSLLCAAYAVLPLSGQPLYTLARDLLPLAFDTPADALPLAPSPLYRTATPAAAEWLDVLVRVVMENPSLDPDNAPVPDDLRAACWQSLHTWQDWQKTQPQQRTIGVRSLLRMAAASGLESSLPQWAKNNLLPDTAHKSAIIQAAQWLIYACTECIKHQNGVLQY